MVCFLQALVLKQGVGGQPFVWVYCLFCSYDHLTAPGGWGANSDRCYYHTFYPIATFWSRALTWAFQ